MRITEAAPREHFRLFLRFEDGTAGEVDLSGFAGRGVFAAWQEPGVFEEVHVTDAGGVEWPGELDLCPDALYMQLTGRSAEEVLPSLRSLASHA